MCLIDTLKKILFFNVFAAFLITFVFNDFIYAKDIIIDKKSQQKHMQFGYYRYFI